MWSWKFYYPNHAFAIAFEHTASCIVFFLNLMMQNRWNFESVVELSVEQSNNNLCGAIWRNKAKLVCCNWTIADHIEGKRDNDNHSNTHWIDYCHSFFPHPPNWCTTQKNCSTQNWRPYSSRGGIVSWRDDEAVLRFWIFAHNCPRCTWRESDQSAGGGRDAQANSLSSASHKLCNLSTSKHNDFAFYCNHLCLDHRTL